MRREQFQQFAIVQGHSAQDLTEQLNTALYELRNKNATVTFEGLIARIEYTETRQAAENLADEYESKGVRLTCQDCPFFSPIRKADGTVDRRIRWGDCPNSEFGRTIRDGAACDHLFRLLNSGEIRLTLAGEE